MTIVYCYFQRYFISFASNNKLNLEWQDIGCWNCTRRDWTKMHWGNHSDDCPENFFFSKKLLGFGWGWINLINLINAKYLSDVPIFWILAVTIFYKFPSNISEILSNIIKERLMGILQKICLLIKIQNEFTNALKT